MERKTKEIAVVIIGLTLMLISLVNAFEITTIQGEEGSNYPSDNFLGRIISSVQYFLIKSGDFTVHGQELGCSIAPTQSGSFTKGETMILKPTQGEAFFVDWFRGSQQSQQFMREDFAQYGKHFSWSYVGLASGKYIIDGVFFKCDAGAYWDNKCYYEVYSCPMPCYSDKDCISGNEFCDKSVLSKDYALSKGIPNGGVCKTSGTAEQQATQKTQVYRCENGQKNSLGEVGFGDANFCPNPSDSKYLLSGNVDQCLSEEPLICREIPRIDVQKGITNEQLNSFTSQDLLKSLCTSTDQCETGTCMTLKSLKDNDIITEEKKTDLLTQASMKIIPIGTGALTGVAICSSIAALGGLGTAGATWVVLPLCAAVGGSAGNLADEFVKGIGENIQNRNDQKVGYCIIEETGFFSQLAFFEITGNKNTDGIIIFFGGIVLLLFLLRMLVYQDGEKYEI